MPKIHSRRILILAGGMSTRMGFPKGLLDFKGQPWLQQQLNSLKKIQATHVLIVLASSVQEYFKKIPWLQNATHQPLRSENLLISVRINSQPALGPFSSLRVGLEAMGGDSNLFLLPIDVPCPGLPVWVALETRLVTPVATSTANAAGDTSKTLVALPSYQGRGGHPVLLSEEFQHQLLQVPLDSSEARLDRQIQAIPLSQKQWVNVEDPLIRMNLNSPLEWKQFNLGSTWNRSQR